MQANEETWLLGRGTIRIRIGTFIRIEIDPSNKHALSVLKQSNLLNDARSEFLTKLGIIFLVLIAVAIGWGLGLSAREVLGMALLTLLVSTASAHLRLIDQQMRFRKSLDEFRQDEG